MAKRKEKLSLDWENIGFRYWKTDFRYVAEWKDGKWGEGELTDEADVTINESSPVFHYGQACFEGLKARTTRDGRVAIFRPGENAKRMRESAARLLMVEVPEDMFLDACIRTVEANWHWVPPYGSEATLYIRPYLIGTGENLGLKPAPEYKFSVFVSPVGPYFPGGMKPIRLCVADYDRAAPRGTGRAKAGGNYAGGLLPHKIAADRGFTDCLYLDATTRTHIEEVGAANFFGITKDEVFVTPESLSILRSITRRSLIDIARLYLDMSAEERPVLLTELDHFVEAGACGTAAVITPISEIAVSKEQKYLFFHNGLEGSTTEQLYNILVAIQRGEMWSPDWLTYID